MEITVDSKPFHILLLIQFILLTKIKLRIQQEQHLSPAQTAKIANNKKVFYCEVLKTIQKFIQPL